MVVPCKPEQVQYEGDRPVALRGVPVRNGGGFRDVPLASPTTYARTPRGTWALFPLGDQVALVWPRGALLGRPGDVRDELDRLLAAGALGELDRAAAGTLRRFLVGEHPQAPQLQREAPGVPTGYWLSGPGNAPEPATAGNAPPAVPGGQP